MSWKGLDREAFRRQLREEAENAAATARRNPPEFREAWSPYYPLMDLRERFGLRREDMMMLAAVGMLKCNVRNDYQVHGPSPVYSIYGLDPMYEACEDVLTRARAASLLHDWSESWADKSEAAGVLYEILQADLNRLGL